MFRFCSSGAQTLVAWGQAWEHFAPPRHASAAGPLGRDVCRPILNQSSVLSGTRKSCQQQVASWPAVSRISRRVLVLSRSPRNSRLSRGPLDWSGPEPIQDLSPRDRSSRGRSRDPGPGVSGAGPGPGVHDIREVLTIFRKRLSCWFVVLTGGDPGRVADHVCLPCLRFGCPLAPAHPATWAPPKPATLPRPPAASLESGSCFSHPHSSVLPPRLFGSPLDSTFGFGGAREGGGGRGGGSKCCFICDLPER